MEAALEKKTRNQSKPCSAKLPLAAASVSRCMNNQRMSLIWLTAG